MKIGWDPIDELEDKTPTPAWESALLVTLVAVAILVMIFCR